MISLNSKKLLIVSLIINFLFLSASIVFITKKGGISYVSGKFYSSAQSQDKHFPYYYDRESLFDKFPSKRDEIIFLGDSITDYSEWDELFQNPNIVNRGIAGDTSDGILDRLNQAIKDKPSKIFIMIGINDLQGRKEYSYVVQNYDKIISKVKQESPGTKLFVQSVLPVNEKKYSSNISKNTDVAKLNSDIAKLDEDIKNLSKRSNVTYIDISSVLSDDGQLNNKYTTDGLHLNGDAYEIWKHAIQDYVRK